MSWADGGRSIVYHRQTIRHTHITFGLDLLKICSSLRPTTCTGKCSRKQLMKVHYCRYRHKTDKSTILLYDSRAWKMYWMLYSEYHCLPEQCFDTFWQLCATSISRVHCDKDAHSIIESDFSSFKLESFQMMHEGVSNGLHLNRQDLVNLYKILSYKSYYLWRYHRQDRCVNSVELVKTSPSSTLGEAGKDFTDRL